MSLTGYTFQGSGIGDVGEYIEHEVPTPPGKILLGGGAQVLADYGVLLESSPYTNANGDQILGWRARAKNNDQSQGTPMGSMGIMVWLILADA